MQSTFAIDDLALAEKEKEVVRKWDNSKERLGKQRTPTGRKKK